MNFLRSKLSSYLPSSLTTTNHSQSNKQIKESVFQSLKQWDSRRAEKLGRHLKIIQQILQSLQTRVKASQYYLLYIQGILLARLRQLQTYKSNSLNNSTFVLTNHKEKGYQQSYDLLKQLVMLESAKQQTVTQKYKKLKSVFAELCDFNNQESQTLLSSQSLKQISLTSKKSNSEIGSQTSIAKGEEEEEQQQQLDETSVAMLKSNVRYLIDCELPDIIEQNIKYCQDINRVYHAGVITSQGTLTEKQSAQDFYILITKFLLASQKQLQKHRQIARELVNLNNDFIQRQNKRNTKIKHVLSAWVRIDQNANELLIKQLEKTGNQSLIRDYYNIDDMLYESSLEQMYQQEKIAQNIQEHSVEEYLLQVSVQAFQEADKLLLFKCDAFYNKKIQSHVIITIDGVCHLKKPHSMDPDFSFLLSKQIYITQSQQFVFKVQRMQKKLLKAAQLDFEFSLQFNIDDDIQDFIEILSKYKLVNLKCN